MYVLHPNKQLQQLFASQPYQGVHPKDATYIFLGLDANYAPDIEQNPIFSTLLEYHTNAIAFWKKYQFHHPFLLKDYKGNGKKYHKEFSKIGIPPHFAEQVAFIEVLDVATTGINKLSVHDLNLAHIQLIKDSIFSGTPKVVFMSDTVFQLLKKTKIFSWLTPATTQDNHLLKVFYQDSQVVIYKYLHFSTFGKFQEQKTFEMNAIAQIMKIQK